MTPLPPGLPLPAPDPRAVAVLRRAAREESPAALRGVAREFESLFLAMMLRSMRAGLAGNGPFDSDATRLYRELSDQQLARTLATTGRGFGLADLLLSQLGRHATSGPAAEAGPAPLKREAGPNPPGRESPVPPKAGLPGSDLTPLKGQAERSDAPETPRDFVAAVWPHAVAAGRALGVPPAFLVAQAALESGWGRREIRLPDGSASHNLFGIKAGADWQGRTVEITTTEYVNGAPKPQRERFRAYDSYAEAFADYVRLLKSSPRYEGVAGAADFSAFAAALQRAGYATDPDYGAKLARVFASRTFREAMTA